MPSRPVEAPNSTTTLPGPGGSAAHELLARREAERHRVDQAVLLVGPLEVDLAAHRRHADRVAVVADAGDRPVEQVASACALARLPEAQRVEHRDRPRADREDVAQDPADAGGCALEGLDRARVVVGLDLEGAHEPGAGVDGARVLTRPHHDVRAFGGQGPQKPLRVLVGAVLAPEQRVHRQLDLVRRAGLLDADQLVLALGEPEGERVCEGRERSHARSCAAQAATPSTARRIERKMHRPSVEPPVSSCTACSGWGIRPITLPASLLTPAMSFTEPLKFSPGA